MRHDHDLRLRLGLGRRLVHDIGLDLGLGLDCRLVHDLGLGLGNRLDGRLDGNLRLRLGRGLGVDEVVVCPRLLLFLEDLVCHHLLSLLELGRLLSVIGLRRGFSLSRGGGGGRAVLSRLEVLDIRLDAFEAIIEGGCAGCRSAAGLFALLVGAGRL